jgi:hypothetical protein
MSLFLALCKAVDEKIAMTGSKHVIVLDKKTGKPKAKPPRTPKPIAKGKRLKAEREAKAWAKAQRKTT